jgi:hypothetical protein
MMYYSDINTGRSSSIKTYDPREQMLAVLSKGTTPELTMTLERKFFVGDLLSNDDLDRKPRLHTLDYVVFSSRYGKNVILDAMGCDMDLVDKLKGGDDINIRITDPEITLSKGGGWAVMEATTIDGQVIYSPLSQKRYGNLS